MIQPSGSFKDNLQLMPSIEGLARVDLLDAEGNVVASIENLPGKQGSLAVYQYLHKAFGSLNADAARHGILVFAEHGDDAKNRPGAHPNIDRLFAIVESGEAMTIGLIQA